MRGPRRRRGAVDERIGGRRAGGLNALGRHLLLELFDCDPDAINNLETVKGALVEAARRAQATIVDVLQPEIAATYLVEQFASERTAVVDVQRGMFLNSAVPIVNKSPVAVS